MFSPPYILFLLKATIVENALSSRAIIKKEVKITSFLLFKNNNLTFVKLNCGNIMPDLKPSEDIHIKNCVTAHKLVSFSDSIELMISHDGEFFFVFSLWHEYVGFNSIWIHRYHLLFFYLARNFF